MAFLLFVSTAYIAAIRQLTLVDLRIDGLPPDSLFHRTATLGAVDKESIDENRTVGIIRNPLVAKLAVRTHVLDTSCTLVDQGIGMS
jgi:hypothetical protein